MEDPTAERETAAAESPGGGGGESSGGVAREIAAIARAWLDAQKAAERRRGDARRDTGPVLRR